jgi:outer membrane protein assembly factor BamB
MDAGENVARMEILGDYIYVLTDTNYLFCVDRNTGKTGFSASVAMPKMPVSAPAYYKNTVYIVAENKLVVFDTLKMTEISRTILPISVFGDVAANEKYIYLSSTDNRLHIFNANTVHELFRATADKVQPITSVIAKENTVIFATEGGHIICMDSSSPKKIWQFNAVGSITAPLVSKADFIYAAGRDTNIYKINAETGKKVWKFPFHAGSALAASPRPTESIVYQYAQRKGLYAVDANSGKQLWLLPDGIDILAEANGFAYLIDKNNNCVVMDNAKTKKMYTINFAPITAYAPNTADGKIYVMDGRNISCIAPNGK